MLLNHLKKKFAAVNFLMQARFFITNETNFPNFPNVFSQEIRTIRQFVAFGIELYNREDKRKAWQVQINLPG